MHRKPHECLTCGDRFGRKDHLLEHQRRRHAPPSEPGLLGEDVRGSGQLGWSTLILRPGQLVRWTENTSFYVVAPAVVAGIEVPAWWSREVVMGQLMINQGDLDRMDLCVTAEVDRQRNVVQQVKDQLLERMEEDPVWEEEDMTVG